MVRFARELLGTAHLERVRAHGVRSGVWRATSPVGTRLYLKRRPPRAYAQETAAYRDWVPRLPGHGPRLVAATDAKRGLFAVSEVVGDNGAAALREAHLRLHILEGAGRCLRALHELPHVDDDPLEVNDALQLRADHCLAIARPLVPIGQWPAVRAALKQPPRATRPRAPCHRDFQPDNWLVDLSPPGTPRFALIDFEHSRADHPMVDLAKLQGSTLQEPAAREAFFAGYGALTDGDEELLRWATDLHAVVTHCWAHRHDVLCLREEAAQLMAQRFG